MANDAAADPGAGGRRGAVSRDAGRADAGGPVDAGSTGPGFSRVQLEVFEARHCDSYLCHGANAGGLDLEGEDDAYADLVDAPATGLDCRELGLPRVAPGEPERSLLYLKLFEDAPCGEMMPPPPTRPLSDEHRALIREWIAAGARR
jgi:hypothetical protein